MSVPYYCDKNQNKDYKIIILGILSKLLINAWTMLYFCYAYTICYKNTSMRMFIWWMMMIITFILHLQNVWNLLFSLLFYIKDIKKYIKSSLKKTLLKNHINKKNLLRASLKCEFNKSHIL